MELVDYIPVLIQVLFAVFLAAAILIASQVFGQRAKGNYIKDKAYECGLPMEGNPHPRFGVKFYVVAMLFILFDIEAVFLIPWVLIYREFISLGIPILMPVMFFIAVLVLGLAYEMKKKGLEWER
ncbi:NADH-quinone oxidoreductase subunit A [Rubellicoccus peritrichatus]|uniref:NADH-quinone oxidoreductase subunit A n=1 Tax=Rubellicoccus peritrichatus TaxID=3080537 RepID=A0AAQ3L9A4_9BACT|nr:NADH-quinone oxidoreductase subunit A [Puniceicoccus sp. CR14]WOO41201.1 NADH-quinone oxidoreductase subunit A [Puniceicoccus sp. CR14]